MATASSTEDESIKSMQLYCNIDRIWNELHELGYSRDKDNSTSIPVETINQFDCYDYSGGKDLIKVFPALDASSYVLDIGSGLGGPARFLSHHTSCNVVGVELQEDVAALGNSLSVVSDMDSRVNIIAGDFTDTSVQLHPGPSESNTYDAVRYLLLPLVSLMFSYIPFLVSMYAFVTYESNYSIVTHKLTKPITMTSCLNCCDCCIGFFYFGDIACPNGSSSFALSTLL